MGWQFWCPVLACPIGAAIGTALMFWLNHR